MKTDEGFILLSRSFSDSIVFQNEKWLKVFIWCLMKASYRDRKYPVVTGKGVSVVELQRGQFIFGRNTAAKSLNMKPSTVRNILEKLKKLGNLSIKKDSHYSIVTVCNYNTYQDLENYGRTGKRTGKGQAKDTNKKGKESNKEIVTSIVEYLNQKLGSKYKPTTLKTKESIQARINEDYKLEDFKTVIDKKYNSWFGTEQAQYLRPETLFGNKFESYLNEIQTNKPESNKLDIEKYTNAFQWAKTQINGETKPKFKEDALNKIIKKYPLILEYDLESSKFKTTYSDYLKL